MLPLPSCFFGSVSFSVVEKSKMIVCVLVCLRRLFTIPDCAGQSDKSETELWLHCIAILLSLGLLNNVWLVSLNARMRQFFGL